MCKYKIICIYQTCSCSSYAHQYVITVEKVLSTMLFHIHLHSETPPISNILFVYLFVFKAIPASVAIFTARNIMAELYHVFAIYFC